MGSGIERAAHEYAARGWSVIPIEPRAKRPIAAWLPFQRRRASADEIDAWLRRWPHANVAVVTGKISGLVVLDVDARHDGVQSLARLEAAHGALPDTVECRTGGDGRHLYFAHPGRRSPNRVGIVPGIDVRGDGGCVVVPPSIHPTGRAYAWVPGHGPGTLSPAPMPDWLLALIRKDETRDAAIQTPRRTRARTHATGRSANG
jgi:hypothetical protein